MGWVTKGGILTLSAPCVWRAVPGDVDILSFDDDLDASPDLVHSDIRIVLVWVVCDGIVCPNGCTEWDYRILTKLVRIYVRRCTSSEHLHSRPQLLLAVLLFASKDGYTIIDVGAVGPVYLLLHMPCTFDIRHIVAVPDLAGQRLPRVDKCALHSLLDRKNSAKGGWPSVTGLSMKRTRSSRYGSPSAFTITIDEPNLIFLCFERS